jgi:predicted AlkP superfamily pyrophosphatase or phosphodiesterase
MVIFIMIDGMRPDAIPAATCPHLTSLIDRGSSTMTARSVMPSITLPCHTSIFHSVPPSRHGITANLYLPFARPLPGLVEVARGAGLRSAFIYNWEPLRDLSRPETLHYSYFREAPHTPEYDDAVAAESVRLLREEHYDFLFIYFGSVDGAGHLYGWMSPEYLSQLSRVDRLLGEVLAVVPHDATLIVHADHGGHERTHGTEMPEDMTIPWIAVGPTIRRGHSIAAPVSLLDTAPTIAHLLGLKAPTDWEGKPVAEIFA